MGTVKGTIFWTSVSAAALLTAACSPEAPDAPNSEPIEEAAPQPDTAPVQTPPDPALGGEGGESGMGGETGVDAAAAGDDPIVFLTALEIIRAHYLAGEAAFEAGNREAGGEMFAHPISEVYIDLEPVFADLGVEPFVDLMQRAVDLAFEEDTTVDEMKVAILDVLTAVDAAGTKAPESDDSAARVEGAVMADLAQRVAAQYQYVTDGGPGEAWLDGFGYLSALQTRAAQGMGEIEAVDEGAAEVVAENLEILSQTFPSVVVPDSFELDVSRILGAASAIEFAVASL